MPCFFFYIKLYWYSIMLQFLGTILIRTGAILLILAECLHFVAALYDSSSGMFGLFACNTQVMLAWSEYCRFRALE